MLHLLNATSLHGPSQRFHFFEALRKRERFRRKCYSYITHCMSACKRFAAQFSSMLHLLNATSLHGLGRMKVMPSVSVFIFSETVKHCARENAFDASVIVIHHTLHVWNLTCKRFAAQFSSMLHLLNATSLHGLGRMKVMLVEHQKMWNPFPLESFTGHLLFFFGRSSFFLRNGQNLISLKQGEIWPSRTGHVKWAS